MTPEQLEILRRPFPPELILKRHDGLRYVEGIHYCDRLTEAFNGDWSFEILSMDEVESKGPRGSVVVEVSACVTLQAEGVERTQFGCQALNTGMTRGEARKAAVTDALKKAASTLGVGMDLYSKVEPQKDQKPVGPVRGPRSTDLRSEIFRIARSKNIEMSALGNIAQRALGVRTSPKIKDLSDTDARIVLDVLEGKDETKPPAKKEPTVSSFLAWCEELGFSEPMVRSTFSNPLEQFRKEDFLRAARTMKDLAEQMAKDAIDDLGDGPGNTKGT